jgi:hypothetical protein
MGNTATSLHLLKPPAGARGLDRNIRAAYEALGYAARPAGTEAQKRVAIADAGEANAFLSIYDSDNALIDNGELKQLAVALSKRLKTAAVLTSIYDSDHFEFIVFHRGRQVDAVVSDPDQHAAGLKMLKAGRRIDHWKQMFFVPAIQRALATSGTPPGSASMNVIRERERAFDAIMARVGKIEGAFAEDGLSACCEAAGLDVGHALARDGDEKMSASSRLSFEKLAAGQPANASPASRAAAGEIKLAPYLSDDDCPSLRYFPAAWPFVAGAPVRTDWLVVSSGAGFSGLKLTFAISGAPAGLTGKLIVRALPFYNGQITSTTPIASFEQSAPPISDGAWVFDVAPFAIPDLNPEARNRIILVIALEVAGAEAITIRPAIAAASAGPIELPPVKLRAQRPGWIPQVAGDAAATKASSILRLNEPSVFSMVALLDDDATALAAIRQWAEAWLAALVADGAELSVATHKHMSASFRVAKAERTLPLRGASAHSQWPKLFDAKSDYQTVMLRVTLSGRSFPVAGFTWQAALRNGLRPDPDQALKYLRDTVGPYVGADAPPVENDGGNAVSVALWVLNDPAIFDVLETTPDDLATMFETWMAGKAPIQAWITRAAWLPELDFYEQYNQTLYEMASTIDWFRSHMNGLLASRAWVCRRLRFMASTLWLGKELASQVDMERVATIAELSPAGDATCVRLRDGRSLGELEAALAPILPVAQG